MAEQMHSSAAETQGAQSSAAQTQVALPKSSDTTGKTTSTVGVGQVPPFVGGPSYSWGGYIQGLGVMFLLLAGLWFLVRFLKRYGRFNFIPRHGSLPRDDFFMEAQMPLGPGKCLMVVRFLKRRYLLGVTDKQISVLTSGGLGDEDKDDEDTSFAQCVQDANKKQ